MIFEDYTDQVLDAIKARVIAPVVVAGAEAARAGVVKKIETAPPRTGRRQNKGGVRYRSAAPGEAPAEATGAYVDSWTADTVAKDAGEEMRASAGSAMPGDAGIPLGLDLEFGVSQEPRPHIRTALPEIAAEVGEQLRRLR